jgi:hypothetical protein
MNNNSHCGNCGVVCTGGKSCINGLCTCPSGQTDCSGTCVNLLTNNNNCGKCANQCSSGQICNNGICLQTSGCFTTTDKLQAGLTKPQYTQCESVSNNGYTCHNPLIRYGNVPNGVPAQHSSNDFNKWCQQLGCSAVVSVTYGNRSYASPYGKLFWCSSYDENNPKWCDWQDGYWYNQQLDYHPAIDGQAITQITCK